MASIRSAAALALALAGMALIGCGEGAERPTPALSPVATTLPSSPTLFATTDSPTALPTVTLRDQALVTRVIDGDTVEMNSVRGLDLRGAEAVVTLANSDEEAEAYTRAGGAAGRLTREVRQTAAWINVQSCGCAAALRERGRG